MPKTLPPRPPLKPQPRATTKTRPPGPASSRRRALLALCAVALALVLAAGGLALRQWRHGAVPSAAPSATAVTPEEARLLATAAREPGNPQPYRELAEWYAGTAQPASALWAYGEAAARAPEDGTPQLAIAATLSGMGYPRPAESALRALITGGGAAAARARLDLADLLLATGRPEEALAVLRTAGPEAETVRGRCHEAVGDGAAARAAYRRAAAAGSAEAHERLARLELAGGDLAAAQEAARSLAEHRAPKPEDLLLVAAIRAGSGTPQALDTAADRLRRLLEARPRHVEAHYQMGVLALRRGDRPAALQRFQDAVRLDPTHIQARGRLADLLQAMGQPIRAHAERAACYEQKEQPDLALAELGRIPVTDQPGDLDRTLTKIRLLNASGQSAAALKEARAGLARHPGSRQLMLQLGSFYQPGEWRPALEQLCRDWMAKEPASGTPHWLLGRQALVRRRTDEAIGHLATACRKEPARADFSTALALAYMAISTPENLARARPWLEKAIALNPDSPEPRQHLGRILEQTGDLAGARREYLRCLDRQPGRATVLNNLSRLIARLGPPEVARLFTQLAQDQRERTLEHQQLTAQVRLQPANGADRLALARFLIRTGQLTRARHHLERAAASHSPARSALADLDRLLQAQQS